MSTPPPQPTTMDPLTALTTHPFIRATTADKALGTLIGSALGDAIGLYTEFLPKTACHNAYPTSKFSLLPSNLTPFREDGHRDKFEPGDWTDDTDQALTIILSFLHSQKGKEIDILGHGNVNVNVKSGVNPLDIAERIHTWERQGLRCLGRPPLGIGQTIGRVVRDPDYLSSPVEIAIKIWVKCRRDAAPNGSLMRTHPLGVICMWLSEEEAFEVAAEVGRVTHVDPRCVVACCLQVGLVRGILRGEVRGEKEVDELIERAWTWVDAREVYRNPESVVAVEEDEMGWEKVGERPKVEPVSYLDREEFARHCYAKNFAELQLDDSQKMGYVYKCLGTAILSLRMAMRREKESLVPVGSEVFEEIMTELIMEGGDADTNACVAGALMGAWLGYSRLPPHWERGINNREWLLKKSQAVLYRVGILDDEEGKWKSIVESDLDTALDGGRGIPDKAELDKMEMDVLEGILMKQKARRENRERKEKEKKKGIGKWFLHNSREA